MMEGSDNAGETASQHQQSLYHNGAAAAPTTATHRHGRPVVVVPPPGISSTTTTTTTTTTSHQQQQSQGSEPPLTPEQRAAEINRAIQYWLDKSTIHIVPRWTVFVVLLALFFLRVYVVQGYFIVAYGLGIFLLNNFIAFLSPLEDPSTSNSNDDGLSLPVSAKDGKEFR